MSKVKLLKDGEMVEWDSVHNNSEDELDDDENENTMDIDNN
jgi:hypothetical protein